MGFWKTMTEATMTMTLLRQLPTECVTGVTLCRIMYDTCTASQTVSMVNTNQNKKQIKFCAIHEKNSHQHSQFGWKSQNIAAAMHASVQYAQEAMHGMSSTATSTGLVTS